MNFNNAGTILNWKGFEVIIQQPLEHDIEVLERDFHIKGGEFTNEELEQYEAEYNSHLASIDYIEKRVYPPIGDQLDYIYHNGVAAWKTDMIKPVKDKWPKPE